MGRSKLNQTWYPIWLLQSIVGGLKGCVVLILTSRVGKLFSLLETLEGAFKESNFWSSGPKSDLVKDLFIFAGFLAAESESTPETLQSKIWA